MAAAAHQSMHALPFYTPAPVVVVPLSASYLPLPPAPHPHFHITSSYSCMREPPTPAQHHTCCLPRYPSLYQSLQPPTVSLRDCFRVSPTPTPPTPPKGTPLEAAGRLQLSAGVADLMWRHCAGLLAAADTSAAAGAAAEEEDEDESEGEG